jgi:O-antigen ligase
MSRIYYPEQRPAFKLRKSLWAVFIALSVGLFLACHWPLERPAGVDNYNASQDVIVGEVASGSAVRQVALCLLGAAGALSLAVFSNRRRFHIDGLMGWAMIAFLAWASCSIFWAEDPSLSFKRLISFAIYCVTAAAVVRFLSLRQIVESIFFITALFLLIAIAIEIQSGAFHPFVSGYRFSGTQHPNGEGTECGLLVLSGWAAAKDNRQRRSLYRAGALVGAVFLILTVSRTSTVATLISSAILLMPAASLRGKRRIVAGICILAASAALVLASVGYRSLEQKLFPGRDDTAGAESFAGRTNIWKDVTPYFLEHPITGYGYSGFWTPTHIGVISDKEEWGVPDSHSAYVDYLLSLGVVGFSLYVLCLLCGIRRSFTEYNATRDAHYLFLAGLLVFCVIDGLLESGVGEGSLLAFLSIVAMVRLGLFSQIQSRGLTLVVRPQHQKAVSA